MPRNLIISNLDQLHLPKKKLLFWVIRKYEQTPNLRPGLSEALFAQRSGAKKRERKTDKGAQINNEINPFKNLIFAKIIARRFEAELNL